MRYKPLSAMLIFSVMLAGSAFAGEIYKWTDEDGNVHYTDKPISSESEHLNIQSRNTSTETIDAELQAVQEQQAKLNETKAAAAVEEQKDADLSAKADERAEKCSMYRERMTKFVQSRRLYREDENGERVYLDEDQTEAARENVVQKVEEYCNP